MDYFAVITVFKHQLNSLARKLEKLNEGYLHFVAFDITNYACPDYTPSYGQIFNVGNVHFENITGYERKIERLYQEIRAQFEEMEIENMHKLIIFSYLVSKRQKMEKRNDFSWVFG